MNDPSVIGALPSHPLSCHPLVAFHVKRAPELRCKSGGSAEHLLRLLHLQVDAANRQLGQHSVFDRQPRRENLQLPLKSLVIFHDVLRLGNRLVSEPCVLELSYDLTKLLVKRMLVSLWIRKHPMTVKGLKAARDHLGLLGRECPLHLALPLRLSRRNPGEL